MTRTGRLPASLFLLVFAQLGFCRAALAQTAGAAPTGEAPAPPGSAEFPAADTASDTERAEDAPPTAETDQPPPDGSSAPAQSAESPAADIESDADTKAPVQPPPQPPSAPPPSAPVITATPYAPPPTPTQRTSPRTNLLMLGGGGGFGFIYPKEINRYLDDWVNSQPGYVISQEGTSDMFLSFVPSISLVYGPIEYLQFELFAELGWAPKIISIEGGDSHVFNFLRMSPGALALFHIPFNDYENSIFLGGGVEYDWMTFEGASADTMGFRGKAGWRVHDRHATMEAFATFLYSKAETRLAGPSRMERDDPSLVLNYTTVLFGANFYFRAYEE